MENDELELDEEPPMTPQDVARLYSVSEKTVRRMHERGEIPPPDFYAGPRPRWRRAPFLEWWNEQLRSAAPRSEEATE